MSFVDTVDAPGVTGSAPAVVSGANAGKVAYVMEQGTLAGGHKLIMEHLTHLTRRGWYTKLFLIYPCDPRDWFPNLQVSEIEVCFNYDRMRERLVAWGGKKVATWWRTAQVVRDSGGERYYYIQDVETSYAANSIEAGAILETYRYPLRKYTESEWVKTQLERMNLGPVEFVGTGVNHKVFFPRPIEEVEPWDLNEVLFHERAFALKGPELRAQVLAGLKGTGLRTVGYSPWEANPHADEHMLAPSDEVLAERMRHGLCLLVTSLHEGLCMPAMEAMACGLPVVTTDAHGNTFCLDGYNSLVANTAPQLVGNIVRLKNDPQLWMELSDGAIKTAAAFDWQRVIDRLEQILA